MTVRVAVVVATRDRPEMHARCVTALLGALRAGDELVVVDSASSTPITVPDGVALLRSEVPGVNLARNLGWRSTTAELVLFTDDDVEVEPGWVDAYRAGMGPHVFATGWVGAPEGSHRRVAVKVDQRAAVLDSRTPAPLGHGASTAVRRSALEAVGGWDELLGAGARFRSAPELDLYDRLLHLGTGAYLPHARAVHHQWRSDGQLVRLHLRYAIGSGARLAKLLRADRRRFVTAAQESLWVWGLRDVGVQLRHGRLPHAGVAVARLIACAAGFLAALGTPVRDGHFHRRAAD